MKRFVINIVFTGVLAAQFAPAAVFAQTSPIQVLRVLFQTASANPTFMSARRGLVTERPTVSRAPETLDELKAECLKGARANLGFISDGIQKFGESTPIECSNLSVELLARGTASVGGELRLATRPVFRSLSLLGDITRVGLANEFPKRVGMLTAAFNPERLSRLSAARSDASPLLATVASAAEQKVTALGKETFDAVNNELENEIKQFDEQIKSKESALASASDAGAKSALEQEVRLLKLRQKITESTKQVKDDIHECKIAQDGGRKAFDNFREAIADMFIETLKPIIAAMDSSGSTVRRIQSLAENIAIWGKGGTAKLRAEGKTRGVKGTSRGKEIETLMNAFDDALPQGEFDDTELGRIVDNFPEFIRSLFDALGVTDIFVQVGRVEDQLRAALVSKDEKNPSPAVRLSKNICNYDAVLTDLRCAINQLPGAGEASKEIEERVTNYITNRETGGDSPERIANDLLNKILDEAEAQARALIEQALADARAEDEMVPAISAEEINMILTSARIEAFATRGIQGAEARSIQAFVQAFVNGVKQLLRNKKNEGIDQAFVISSKNAEDVAARDQVVATLKREYDVKIDTQIAAAADSAFAGLVEKLDELISGIQNDFPLKRSDFQVMTQLQGEAARLQATLEQSLKAVQARLAKLLSIKNLEGREGIAFVRAVRSAYKTGGDTQEAKLAAVDKAIDDFFAGKQRKASPKESDKPTYQGPKVRND